MCFRLTAWLFIFRTFLSVTVVHVRYYVVAASALSFSVDSMEYRLRKTTATIYYDHGDGSVYVDAAVLRDPDGVTTPSLSSLVPF